MPYQLGQVQIFRLGEKGSGTKLRFSNGYQDCNEILKDLLASGKLFEDPEFPLSEETLKTNVGVGDLFWKRPYEIQKEYYQDNKKVVFSAQGAGDSSAISRFDVSQGSIGNCGSVAAFADSTIHKETREMVFCDDNTFEEGRYAGIFHFRVYRMGRWIDVVVDDRIPVHKNSKPYSVKPLASDKESEYWPCLLEKVRAKLGQSYEGWLTGGGTENEECFSGGLWTKIDLTLPGASARIQKLWDESAIGVTGGFSKEEGLISGHAYSINGFVIFNTIDDERVELIRLRNPWGYHEYTGPWSDNSEEWKRVSQETKDKCGLVVRDDGEFWMALKDYQKYTTRNYIWILSLLPQELNGLKEGSLNYVKHLGRWNEGHIYGKFDSTSQYCIKIDRNEPTWASFSLCALNSVIGVESKENIKIGYQIFKLGKNEFPVAPEIVKTLEKVDWQGGTFGTTVDARTWKLDPGSYLVCVYVMDQLPEANSGFDEYALRIMWEK